MADSPKIRPKIRGGFGLDSAESSVDSSDSPKKCCGFVSDSPKIRGRFAQNFISILNHAQNFANFSRLFLFL